MTVRPLPTDFLIDLPFGNVLVNQHANVCYGVHFGGDRPGPNALFGASSSTIDAVSRRLIKLPTLPWIWGQLYLIAVDLIPAGKRDNVPSCIPSVIFDDITISVGSNQDRGDDPDAAYWTVLRQCTRLGMIQGRGVAP